MKNALENKLSMYETVGDLLRKKQDLVTSLPALTTAVDQFNVKLGLLHEAVRNQMKTSKGATLDKLQAKTALIEKMVLMSKGTTVYLVATNNNVSENLVKINASTLDRERDALLAERCRLAAIEIQNYIANLADYGIEQADLDQLFGLIDSYEQVLSTPRNAVVDRKNATERIEALCNEIDELLARQIDGLVAVAAKDLANEKNLYTNARKIVNYQSGGTKLMGSVSNALGKGIQNARIEAYLGDDEVADNKIETTTDKFGKFVFQGIEAGSYTVKVFINNTLQSIEKSDVRRGKQSVVALKLNYLPPRNASE